MYVSGTKRNKRRYKYNNMEPMVLPIIQKDKYSYFCFEKVLIYIVN